MEALLYTLGFTRDFRLLESRGCVPRCVHHMEEFARAGAHSRESESNILSGSAKGIARAALSPRLVQ